MQLQISAQGHGWREIDGKLEIVWMAYPPAPDSIMELITCNCRRSICNEDCQCRILLMECTAICHVLETVQILNMNRLLQTMKLAVMMVLIQMTMVTFDLFVNRIRLNI